MRNFFLRNVWPFERSWAGRFVQKCRELVWRVAKSFPYIIGDYVVGGGGGVLERIFARSCQMADFTRAWCTLLKFYLHINARQLWEREF